jgi:hypothetical protein
LRFDNLGASVYFRQWALWISLRVSGEPWMFRVLPAFEP